MSAAFRQPRPDPLCFWRRRRCVRLLWPAPRRSLCRGPCFLQSLRRLCLLSGIPAIKKFVTIVKVYSASFVGPTVIGGTRILGVLSGGSRITGLGDPRKRRRSNQRFASPASPSLHTKG